MSNFMAHTEETATDSAEDMILHLQEIAELQYLRLYKRVLEDAVIRLKKKNAHLIEEHNKRVGPKHAISLQ
jgi:hypothetical protein